LTPGGSIGGQVRRENDQPAAGYTVMVFAGVSREELPYTPPLSYLGVRTDVRGRYQLSGLHPGAYYVAAERRDLPFGPGRGFYPLGLQFNEALTVTVQAGAVVEGIDIPLGLEPSAYLPITGR
jgi:hypothetical protein